MNELLLGLAIGLMLAGFVFATAALIEERKRRDSSFPYWLRNGVEDATGNTLHTLLSIRELLEWVEIRLESQRELLGEIRRGEYDKDQPHKER